MRTFALALVAAPPPGGAAVTAPSPSPAREVLR
jgi:hypothetical protein